MAETAPGARTSLKTAGPPPPSGKRRPRSQAKAAAGATAGLPGLDSRKWPAVTAELRDIAGLIPYARNARTHSPDQVDEIARSIETFGWTMPVLVDEAGEVIAGHGRLLAAAKLGIKRVPVAVAQGWTKDQKRAYAIADNKIALNAGWNLEILRTELVELDAAGFAPSLLGFTELEMVDLNPVPAPADGDVLPEVPKNPVSRHGDIWILGATVRCPKCSKFTPAPKVLKSGKGSCGHKFKPKNYHGGHRVMCGDSTAVVEVSKLTAGQGPAAMLHADPPYGMGKEADGVENDNLTGEKLDAFQMAWWRAWRPSLAGNGSAYIWGGAEALWSLWWRGGLATSEALTMRNEIVWDKIAIAGMASPALTQYPEASERCLFFQVGRHVFLVGQTKDDYWEGWEPVRSWLVAELDKSGMTPKRVREVVGNHMYGHWFGKSQWCIIDRKNYDKLAAAALGTGAFTRPFEELRKHYDELAAIFRGEVRDPRRKGFNAARPYFDNAHEVMHDVWQFSRVTGAERQEHATPKPVAMIERAIKSSSRPGEAVLEPFLGSGSTVIAAERTGRRCYGAEISPVYTDVTVARWQDYTKQDAVRLADGVTFNEAHKGKATTDATRDSRKPVRGKGPLAAPAVADVA